MKKFLTLIICISFSLNMSAQQLNENDFSASAAGRPSVDRIFKTADGTRSMLYYADATVSFYNNSKYTPLYVVHNFTAPWRMQIVREDRDKNDMLYYSESKESYTDKNTGVEYILDKHSIHTPETSR